MTQAFDIGHAPIGQLNRAAFARKRRAGESRLYFVRSGLTGPVKVGVAGDVVRRLVALQTGNPAPLYLLTCRAFPNPDAYRAEASVHELFARFRLSGEWFEPAPQLLGFIEALSYQDDLPFALEDARHALDNGLPYVTGGAQRP